MTDGLLWLNNVVVASAVVACDVRGVFAVALVVVGRCLRFCFFFAG